MKGSVKLILVILTPVLLFIIITGYLWHSGFLSRGAPPEEITIGTNINEMLGLLFIAETRGYYQEQGLKVSILVIRLALDLLGTLKRDGSTWPVVRNSPWWVKSLPGGPTNFVAWPSLAPAKSTC